MPITRRLALRREHLAELTADDLRAVAGAQPDQPTKDCPDYTYYCITGPAICEGLSRRVC